MRVGRWTATLHGVLSSKREVKIQEIDGKPRGKVEKKEYFADLSNVGDEDSGRGKPTTGKDGNTEAELSPSKNV